MPKKLDDMHKAIKAQLRKEHPDWSDEECDSKAWAIANSQFKKMKQSAEVKKTEDGKIVVAENVKLILNSTITPVDYIQE